MEIYSPLTIPGLRITDNRLLIVAAVAGMILLIAILLIGFLLSQSKKKGASLPLEESLAEAIESTETPPMEKEESATVEQVDFDGTPLAKETNRKHPSDVILLRS